MAKALFGHVGVGPDLRLVGELQRLRARVRDLEDEVCRLREVNAALASAVAVRDSMSDEMISLTVPDTAEAALT